MDLCVSQNDFVHTGIKVSVEPEVQRETNWCIEGKVSGTVTSPEG